MRQVSRWGVVSLASAVLLVGAAVAQGAFTTESCLAEKRKAWGELRRCQAAEEAKTLEEKATGPGRCQTRFDEELARLDARAAMATVACRYRVNVGSEAGTLTDYDTGLQWEQKTDDGSIHDRDNGYLWWDVVTPGYGPNGTLFTVFLGTLNACQSSDGATVTQGGFAGHCDWRVPTIAELRSVVDDTVEGCRAGSPCIDPIFGPTTTGLYWSSTSGAIWMYAYQVYFYYGSTILNAKGIGHALAVRSAL